MPDRLVLFIDHQNCYKGARRSFFDPDVDHHVRGQFDPMKLGQLICEKRQRFRPTVLQEVRIYTGRPDGRKDPRSYGPHMRQCMSWEANGVTVVPRALRYPQDWPQEKPQEKGIDVTLSIDFISLALDNAFDVGVLFSSDTDLVPAIEFVLERCKARPEVAAWWRGQGRSPRLHVQASTRVWCHWLDESDHRRVEDTVDYRSRPR